jgi:kumamolisin
MAASHVRLEGNERAPKPDAVRVRGVRASSRVEVTVTVRHPELPPPGAPLTRDEFERQYAVSPDDTAAVRRALGRFGLTVSDGPPATGSLVVRGTAAQIEAAFEPRLGVYRSATGREFRGRDGDLKIPRSLHGILTGVFGLDQRRVARRRLRAAAAAPPGADPDAPPLGPAELERRYRFPDGDAGGQTIAIAEFGGAYFPDDVRRYCRRHGRDAPAVTAVPVGLRPLTRERIAALPSERRDEARGETREVMMDVEIVAGLCPKATLRVLFAPFHQKGWIDLLDRALALDPAPVALSVSWGSAEDCSDWSPAARRAINHRLHAAALRGITVCVATGDDGSGDQMQDDRGHVHFPASSPFVLAVGGTMLEHDEREVVWWNHPGDRSERRGGSTGGGVSVEFPRPEWQRVRRVGSINPGARDGRTVPDVAALAGLPGYSLIYNGRPTMNGGTSAAAPLWAALIARIAARRPDVAPAFLTPLLYERRTRRRSAFRDVTHGHNTSPQPGRGYHARDGYDAVSGLGVPDGEALLASL